MKTKILIVDDNEDIRTVLRDVVELLGFDSVEADSMKSGLMVYQDQKADLHAVVTDNDMEALGAGLDLIHSIAEIEQIERLHPTIKILMSGRHEHLENRARAVGAIPMLKPFTLAELKKNLGSPVQALKVA